MWTTRHVEAQAWTNGDGVNVATPTVVWLEQIVPLYLDSLVAAGQSDHTVASSASDLGQLSRFLGRQPLASVSTEDLVAFFVWLRRQRGNGVSSLRRKTSTVKQFFRFIGASGIRLDDPSASLIYPAAVDRLDRPLERDETEAITAAASDSAWNALIVCLLDCGLKRDEVQALRWDDLELHDPPRRAHLHVRHRIASQRSRRRSLAVTGRLATAFRRLGPPPDGDGSVFSLSARGVDFIVETCARRGGVRPHLTVTPQMLRDAYAIGRVAELVRAESMVAEDRVAHATAMQTHNQTLLRELGLADQSPIAARYRRMLATTESYRIE